MATAEEPHIGYVDDDFTAAKVFIWADVLADGSVSLSLLGQDADHSFRIVSRHVPPEHSSSHRTALVAAVPDRRRQAVGPRRAGPVARQGAEVPGARRGLHGHRPGRRAVRHHRGHPGAASPAGTPSWSSRRRRSWASPRGGRAGARAAPSSRPGGREDPFFFLDASNAFFVEPDWTEFSIGDADQSVVAQTPVWHQFDAPDYWAAVPVAAAFPQPADLRVRPGLVLGNVPIEAPVDYVTRPETVVRFDGRFIDGDGLVNPGRLSRSGPHGAVVRTDIASDLANSPSRSTISVRSCRPTSCWTVSRPAPQPG